MNGNQKTFSELQEIIFWQQLNKQLIELRNNGRLIEDEHQRYIQNFCFNNRLFSRVTGATLLDDIPMVLITDLSSRCFINLKLNSWNDSLTQLLPNTYALDIEQALADTFNAMRKYDKTFYPNNKKDGNNEDDRELYEFIEKYLDEKEKQGREMATLIQKTYELKNDVIQWMMGFCDYRPILVLSKNRVFFDLWNSDKQKEIWVKYSENFCQKADSIISPIIFVLKRWDIDGLLLSKEAEENLKPSIKEFIDHEIDITEKEFNLLNSFSVKIHERINSTETYEINVCDLSPFSFLDFPFPMI